MGGANAQDLQGWKRPWGLWGVELRLKEQKGPRHGRGPHLGAQQASWLEWTRQSHSGPLPLSPDSPSCLPLLIAPASGVLILSGLHFSSPLSPPMSYWFTLGFLLSPWVSESPISGQQAP